MGKGKDQPAEVYDSVTDGLKRLYKTKIRPVEEAYKFGDFYSPLLTDGDFDAKPMVRGDPRAAAPLRVPAAPPSAAASHSHARPPARPPPPSRARRYSSSASTQSARRRSSATCSAATSRGSTSGRSRRRTGSSR